jgi:hypothetical protein
MPGMSTRWRIVIVLGCVAVVFVAAAIVFVPMFLRSGDAPKAAAEEYLDAVQANDLSGSYEMLCNRLRKAMTKEQYQAQISTLNSAQPIMFVDAFFGLAAPMTKEARVNIEVATIAASHDKIAVMQKEDGDWRWCGTTGANSFGGSKLDPRQ